MNTNLLKRSRRHTPDNGHRYAVIDCGTDLWGWRVTLRIYPDLKGKYYIEREIVDDNPRGVLHNLFYG